MIRINRLIKKSSLFKLLDLPHVAKIEIVRRKTNQKDKSVIRVLIYLTKAHTSDERAQFKSDLCSILSSAKTNSDVCNTINTALRTGFLKESTCNELNIPINQEYKNLCNMYNQEFFDKF